jgi:putative flavoprotein involved in K+ transport
MTWQNFRQLEVQNKVLRNSTNLKDSEVVVVGGGQAGLAISEHLSQLSIPHLVLERYRIAERWRTERWDSLVANGPAWHDKFPTMDFSCDPEAFPSKYEIADYFERFAEKISAPVLTGVNVSRVSRCEGTNQFCVETSAGSINAQYVVAATGPFQKPVIPKLIPSNANVLQMHSSAYRNPNELPRGAILVVGAGSSGSQIAEELNGAGRKVFLSVGAHGRPPRRYRDRDFVWWLGVLNKWDIEATPDTTHVTIAVSGVNGGHTVDFRRLASCGIKLVGSTESFVDGTITFKRDLAQHLAAGDADYLSLLDEADAYVISQGLDLPEDPDAREIGPDPKCVTQQIESVNIESEEIGTIIWSTGYERDFSWIQTRAVDSKGLPIHKRGISAEPGIYFLGLPWQTRRGSSFIWGVWHDAKYVADHIAKQRAYVSYRKR